jgi:CRISPR-associated protein Cas1
MGVEGQAARRYVRCWPHLLTAYSMVPAPKHRASRPPTDPVNAALSFGYGLLRVAVRALSNRSASTPTSATCTASDPANRRSPSI